MASDKLLALIAAVVLLLAACTGPAQAPPDTTDDCPSCGALWGITTAEPTLASLTETERRLGRSFDFVYRFHDLDDQIPTPDERRVVDQGKTLHVSIDSRLFGGRPVGWAEVAYGEWDTELRRQAEGIAALDGPVFVTFEHEADQPDKTMLGSAIEFRAAWRHLHELYRKAGATNVLWTWVVMGEKSNFPRAGSLWPGNDVVDWISWEGYNASGCRTGRLRPERYVSFADAILPFYRWLHHQGNEYGIDTSKPIMISEAGSVIYPADPQRAADWYAEIPSVLQKYPQIKAVGLWDHRGSKGICDYRFSRTPVVRDAVAQAGSHRWVNTPRPGQPGSVVAGGAAPAAPAPRP